MGSYSESVEPWYDDYIKKMALYGFELSPSDTINRDYFVYMLRTIEANLNKQEEVVEEEEEQEEVIEEDTTPNDTTVEDNETVVIDDNTTIEDDNTTIENNETIVVDENSTIENNSTIEDNTTVEIVGETAIGGLEYWFEPYRCFDSTAPKLELVVENDIIDSANNRILDLEYYTTGGSQSCVDTEGDSHHLAFGTRWRGEELEFGDLTPSDGDTRYKRVRVTIPSGKATEIRLAVITTLGMVMVQSLFIDESGNITKSEAITYGLNGIEVKDPNILANIKSVISELESIKLDVNALITRTRSIEDDNAIKQKFDALKKRLDDAKKLLDDVKQSIDNSDEDKEALKKEADAIKKAIDDVKKLIDGYKKDADNSPEAIADINSKIDGVIGMMVTRSIDDTHQSNVISISRGWNLVSGNVNILTLPQEVHSIWNVGEANWYGFSPHKSIRGEIRDKYRLMDMHIRAYKGTQILATADTEIELIDDYQFNAIQSYGKGLTIHGANNKGFSVSDIQCNEPYTLYGVFKLNGEEIEVYSPNIEVNNYTNFDYIYKNDGYYTYCINK